MKKTIMIIDDDPDDVQLFCEAVAEIDPLYNCLVAYNGEEALKLLQNINTTPDFIFLDLNMPRMNGKQCLAQFKKIPLFSIPVIIYTTSKLKKDIEECLRLGAATFLTKPMKFDALIKGIACVLAGEWELAKSIH